MMKFVRSLAGIVALTVAPFSIATAQPASDKNNETAMAQKLLSDLQTEIQLNAHILTLEDQIKVFQTKVDQLQKQVDSLSQVAKDSKNTKDSKDTKDTKDKK